MAWVSEGGKAAYLDVVRSALKNEGTFSVFKRLHGFTSVVGMGEHWHGLHCYKHVQPFPHVRKNLDAFAKNDTLGRPDTMRFKEGRYGFDTLRFAESICYLFNRFDGDLNGKTIVELGSNYGGLCFCMLTQWPEIKAYHLIDLPDVQELSRMYLRKLGVEHPAIRFYEPKEAPNIFISEYCLSELENWQELYERYRVADAEGLLIRSNFPDPEEEEAFFRVLRESFTIEVTPEPQIRIPNKIVLGYK